MRDLSSLTRDLTYVPTLQFRVLTTSPIKVIEVGLLPSRSIQTRCLEVVLNHQVRTDPETRM